MSYSIKTDKGWYLQSETGFTTCASFESRAIFRNLDVAINALDRALLRTSTAEIVTVELTIEPVHEASKLIMKKRVTQAKKKLSEYELAALYSNWLNNLCVRPPAEPGWIANEREK